jgi:thiol-disulfide isomerase/thioredoxin
MRASAAPALRVALPRAAMRASALQRCSAAARAPTTQRPSFGACRPRRCVRWQLCLQPCFHPLAPDAARRSAAGSVRVRAEGDAAASPPPEPSAPPPGASGNTALAGAAVAAGVALFVLTRATGGVSLAALQAESVPIEQALRNGRPTVVEFYADWCEVCRETAPNIADVERSLKDRLNFVMLNVDNAKVRC